MIVTVSLPTHASLTFAPGACPGLLSWQRQEESGRRPKRSGGFMGSSVRPRVRSFQLLRLCCVSNSQKSRVSPIWRLRCARILHLPESSRVYPRLRISCASIRLGQRQSRQPGQPGEPGEPRQPGQRKPRRPKGGKGRRGRRRISPRVSSRKLLCLASREDAVDAVSQPSRALTRIFLQGHLKATWRLCRPVTQPCQVRPSKPWPEHPQNSVSGNALRTSASQVQRRGSLSRQSCNRMGLMVCCASVRVFKCRSRLAPQPLNPTEPSQQS